MSDGGSHLGWGVVDAWVGSEFIEGEVLLNNGWCEVVLVRDPWTILSDKNPSKVSIVLNSGRVKSCILRLTLRNEIKYVLFYIKIKSCFRHNLDDSSCNYVSQVGVAEVLSWLSVLGVYAGIIILSTGQKNLFQGGYTCSAICVVLSGCHKAHILSKRLRDGSLMTKSHFYCDWCIGVVRIFDIESQYAWQGVI